MSTFDTVSLAEGAPVSGRPKPKSQGGGFGRYLLVRFLLIFPTIFILVTIVFFLMRTTGDPITAAQGGRLGPEALAELRAAAGYDRPIWIQYFEYLGQIATFNFGSTLTTNQPVLEVLATYGPATFELVFYSLIVAFAVGIPLGLLAAYHRDKPQDAVYRVLAILWYAVPIFFAGLLLKLIFAVWLKWLPVAGRASVGAELQMQLLPNKTGFYTIDALMTGDPAVIGDVLQHAVLPSIALGLLTAGIFLRLGAHERDRHALDRLRRRGTVAWRRRIAAAPQACVPSGAHPDRHGHRTADRPATVGRDPDRDDLRVEGPRLHPRRVPRIP